MPFKWGIIGLGSIAKQFATGLKAIEDAQLVAVGSRSLDKAKAFASEFGATTAYGSYEEVASDPIVDAIYIATPHSEHQAGAELCINAGKPTLVEKPFTINADQARKVIELARDKNVFLMEAMWTRFIPAMVKTRELIKSGAIGNVQLIQADFGFAGGFNPESRLFNPALGGGALLDVGVYPISLASSILGKPDRIGGFAKLGETGVDEVSTMMLGYPNGALAALTTAVRANTPQQAWIIGDSGTIHIHTPWWKPSSLTLRAKGKEDETFDLPLAGNGYNYEAVEVSECVAAGKTQSDVIPLDETLSIMETMDELRRQWGVKYPME